MNVKNKKMWILAGLTACMVLKPMPVLGDSPAVVEYTLQNEAPVSYITQRGDTLWSVGQKFAIKPTILALANQMQPEDLLLEGKELVIPFGEKVRYSIQPGDTLWGLAKKYNTSVTLLAEHNGIEADEELQVGQPLIVDFTDEKETKTLPAMAEDVAVSNEGEASIPALNLWPVKGVVSSGFGERNGRMHEGIDVAADLGQDIRSLADGIVVFAGARGTYGNAVIINHGKGFRTLYAHASSIEVSAGERVKEGQVIARIGSTGRSTGPHLHLEILYNGVPLNPMDYLPEKD